MGFEPMPAPTVGVLLSIRLLKAFRNESQNDANDDKNTLALIYSSRLMSLGVWGQSPQSPEFGTKLPAAGGKGVWARST